MHTTFNTKLIPAFCVTGGLMLSACATAPETDETPIAIAPPVIQTCTPISALTRVDIPAETKTFYAITQIDNPPYAPIERKEKVTRVVKEAETIFVDSEGRQVTDVCAPEIDPNAPEDKGTTPGA